MKKMLIIFLALLSVTTTVAEAKPIKVSLIAAQGENGLSCDDTKRLFYEVAYHYKVETGSELQLKWFRCMPNPYPKLIIANRLDVLYFWQSFFSKRGRFKGTKVVHFALLNPIKDGGIYYLAGYAIRTCAYGRRLPVGYSNGELYNSDKLARFAHSVIAAKHEIGHLLGANHDNKLPVTVMNEAPLPYVDQYQGGWMPFSERSKKEIKRCLTIK